MTPWIALFLFIFAAGILLMLPVIPAKIIGSGYIRVVTSVSFGLSLLVNVLTKGQNLIAIIFSCILFLTLLVLSFEPSLNFIAILNIFLSALSACLIIVQFSDQLQNAVIFLTSASVLGSALLSMLLGHSFLSNARLPFEILIRACIALAAAIVVRGMVIAVWIDPEKIIQLGSRDQLMYVISVLRFIAGIFFAIILTLMALSCARIKSNQSATGILYVIVAFVVIGEMIGCYFCREKNIYL